MNMPFYVAPEQVMKDRADYARKGIARGRSLVGFRYNNTTINHHSATNNRVMPKLRAPSCPPSSN